MDARSPPTVSTGVSQPSAESSLSAVETPERESLPALSQTHEVVEPRSTPNHTEREMSDNFNLTHCDTPRSSMSGGLT